MGLPLFLGLAGMLVSLLLYYSVIYFCFARLGLGTLMLAVLFMGGLGTGISTGPQPLKVICSTSLLVFLICVVLVLTDHDPQKRSQGGPSSPH